MAAGSSAFKAVAEKFRVSLLSDSNSTERVQCEIGLEGVKILSDDGGRTLRIYPLNHISRWALRERQLVLYTKTPVDVEERTVILQADSDTTRTMLDTLTCSCMQMCELLEEEVGSSSRNKEAGQNAKWAANMLGGGGTTGRAAPDSVEFWHHADKEGWLQSQGEKLKTWRRRWHVLKDGYIFRFMEADVNSTSKPRGIIDLAEVTEVSDGKDTTGRNNSLKLVKSKENINYIADSGTEQVEWVSAIEAAICKIHDDKDPNPQPKPKPLAAASSSRDKGSDLMQQLEKSYNAVTQSSTKREVKVVGYDSQTGNHAASQGYSSGGGFKNYPTPLSPGRYGASAPPPTEDFSALTLGYGIAGANTSSYSTAPSSQNFGSGGGSGAPYSASNGGYVMDPNYGGSQDYAAPSNTSYQPVAVTGYDGYDVFSQGPDQPAKNYPSMQATVADYASQMYQASQSPAARQPSNDYWQQAQQTNYDTFAPSYGGWDSPHAPQQLDYSQPQHGQQAVHETQYSASYGTQATTQYNVSADPWKACYTPEGQQYWHNTVTGLTQWENPTGMA